MSDQESLDTPATESPAAESAETADADSPEALQQERDALQQERSALQDRLLRTAAEFDNYRKRMDRERRELTETASAGVLTEVLAVIDDLERALQVPAVGDAEAYRRGVELIHKQMTDLLRRHGVTPVPAVGTDFDPRVHQAVIHEASPTHRDGEVVEELRRGYTMGDRLLRAAMVKVAKA